MSEKKIKRALISVYHKEGLEAILRGLHSLSVEILSTGGTADFIRNLGIPVADVSSVTQFPEVFGGRVKTLHPAVMGGILNRRDYPEDQNEKEKHGIPDIDLVVVDLYPFEQTLKMDDPKEKDLIEKIDIGGISLIRAAAKNFYDVVVVPSQNEYPILKSIIETMKGSTDINLRKTLAARAFEVSSSYDALIHGWLSGKKDEWVLRYGENPHQKGYFKGDIHSVFEKLGGKELSYNNILDLDAALGLSFDLGQSKASCVIIKHNNPCGVSLSETPNEAWDKALSADPVSAFGGIICVNKEVNKELAEKINSIFFEILAAPSYTDEAFNILKSKPNRIILRIKNTIMPGTLYRSALNGLLIQDRDSVVATRESLKQVTEKAPTDNEIRDLIFAQIIAKHTKSNTIVLAKNQMLLGIGTGQTSRVDALLQAVEKAKKFGFDLSGAVMASDAFFPFPDCVEIAHKEGIRAVIQPGGSIRDKDSIDYCNKSGMAMVFTGIRHFRH
jgi:phosphoribosylaminoimidazolecarboxamide formyltransferase/IMP cyclohydrolase